MGPFVGKTGDRAEIPYRREAEFINVTLEDPYPQVLSVTIDVDNPRTAVTQEVGLPFVEADLTWGTTYGKRHQATVTVGRGTTFAVNANFLTVVVRNIEPRTATDYQPTATVTASVSLGGSARLVPPVREVQVTGLEPSDTSTMFFVPPYASHLVVYTAPALPHRVEFLEGNTGAPRVGAAVAFTGTGRVAVPPNCDRFRVVNTGVVRADMVSAVFELSF